VIFQQPLIDLIDWLWGCFVADLLENSKQVEFLRVILKNDLIEQDPFGIPLLLNHSEEVLETVDL